jgi:hypothetical protein
MKTLLERHHARAMSRGTQQANQILGQLGPAEGLAEMVVAVLNMAEANKALRDRCDGRFGKSSMSKEAAYDAIHGVRTYINQYQAGRTDNLRDRLAETKSIGFYDLSTLKDGVSSYSLEKVKCFIHMTCVSEALDQWYAMGLSGSSKTQAFSSLVGVSTDKGLQEDLPFDQVAIINASNYVNNNLELK